MRRVIPLLFILGAALPADTLRAQSRTRTTASVGVTQIPLGNQWSGALGAATASFGLSARVLGQWGITSSARAVVPTQGRAAIPECVPDGGGCKEYKTPDALFDFSAGAYMGSTDGKLRGSLSVGWLNAAGLRGATYDSSPTVEAGAELAPFPAKRVSLVLGFHLVYMTRDIAGARTLLLPSIGLAF